MKQKIIKILIGIMVATCSLNANAQVKAFEKYADMKNVTYVSWRARTPRPRFLA